MRYVQGNDIYLNIFRMLIGRSVPTTDIAKSSLECFSRLSHWERTSMIRETHSSLDKLHESKMRCSLFHGS